MRTALASFPRSGNTWVCYLIEQLAGQPCGSVDQDRVLPRGPDGIVIKTHALDSHRYGRVLLLIRDPFAAVASYHRWQAAIAGRPVAWEPFSRRALADWLAHARHWLAAPLPRMVASYERLRADPAAGCRRIADWLELSVDEDRIAAALAASTPEQMRLLSPLGERFFGGGTAGGAAFDPHLRHAFLVEAEPVLARLAAEAEAADDGSCYASGACRPEPPAWPCPSPASSPRP